MEISGLGSGPYHLMSRIARGGMADVYLARTAETPGAGDLVAKLMRHDAVPDAPALLRHEALVASMFDHRHILPLLDVLLGPDGPCGLLFPRVHGLSLSATMRAGADDPPRMPFALSAYVISCVAEALGEVHRAEDPQSHRTLDLIHCDVTPSNILLGRDGRVHLIDFGISESRRRKTDPRLVLGKVPYIAPEQLFGQTVDHRADLFSLGVVFLELLIGRRLDGDIPLADLAEAYRSGRGLPDAAAVNPEVPERLRALVATMTAVQPERRPRDAHVVRDVLDDWLMDFAPIIGPEVLSAWLRSSSRAFEGQPHTITMSGVRPTARFRPPSRAMSQFSTAKRLIACGPVER